MTTSLSLAYLISHHKARIHLAMNPYVSSAVSFTEYWATLARDYRKRCIFTVSSTTGNPPHRSQTRHPPSTDQATSIAVVAARVDGGRILTSSLTIKFLMDSLVNAVVPRRNLYSRVLLPLSFWKGDVSFHIEGEVTTYRHLIVSEHLCLIFGNHADIDVGTGSQIVEDT